MRDEDIEVWHAIPFLERAAMEVDSDATRIALAIDRLQKGADLGPAVSEVARYHPIWGNPDDAPKLAYADRPLPIEFFARHLSWQEQHHGNPEAFKRRLLECSSYNALMREAIQRGDL